MNSHVWLCRDLGEALAGVTAEVILARSKTPEVSTLMVQCMGNLESKGGEAHASQEMGHMPRKAE